MKLNLYNFGVVVLWFLVQNWNRMVPCLKSFGTKRTHTHVSGLKGGFLFFRQKLFCFVCPLSSTQRKAHHTVVINTHPFLFAGANNALPVIHQPPLHSSCWSFFVAASSILCLLWLVDVCWAGRVGHHQHHHFLSDCHCHHHHLPALSSRGV